MESKLSTVKETLQEVLSSSFHDVCRCCPLPAHLMNDTPACHADDVLAFWRRPRKSQRREVLEAQAGMPYTYNNEHALTANVSILVSALRYRARNITEFFLQIHQTVSVS